MGRVSTEEFRECVREIRRAFDSSVDVETAMNVVLRRVYTKGVQDGIAMVMSEIAADPRLLDDPARLGQRVSTAGLLASGERVAA